MDILTHIFIPLTIIYFLKKELFNRYYVFALSLFGLLPDFDKALGVPGVLHSIITLTLFLIPLFMIEKLTKGSKIYTSIIAFFIFSHLILDILDVSPIFPLYPLINKGLIVEFPLAISFNSFSFIGPLIQITYVELKTGLNTYEGVISGFGITSMLLFISLFTIIKRREKQQKQLI